MERRKEKARNLRQQGPGPKSRHESATGNSKLAQRNRKRQTAIIYRVTPSDGEPFRMAVSGRDKWALDRLREAGGKGCTPIKQPALRWSAYIHNLRKLGVEIETITEPHEGDFPGHHARYVLRSAVSALAEGGTP